ncbi:hypothetical protein [Photobacterium leiognathi]|uniref:hypothetical protein n=1 Tax=Photobacterium leiognathi TaxID=553611 RepID=UPI0029810A6D|nr:hypothetical protein [Photobacterium leiognathi]
MKVEKKDINNVLAGYEVIGNKFACKRVRDVDVEADILERHLDNLNEFNRHLQVIAILNENENDLISRIDEYCKNTSHNVLSIPEMSENNRNFIEVNRAALNLLSSLKTFLDFSETFLRRKYGKDSSEIKEFKLAQSLQFDENFSYRFCYKLRNYAQHCGLPVGGFATKTLQISETETLSKVTVFVDRDLLISNFDWGAKVKQEILEQDEKIDLGAHLRKFVNCIGILSKALLDIESKSMLISMEYIEGMIDSVRDKYPDMYPVIYNFKTSNSSYGDMYWLPTELIKEIKEAIR